MYPLPAGTAVEGVAGGALGVVSLEQAFQVGASTPVHLNQVM